MVHRYPYTSSTFIGKDQFLPKKCAQRLTIDRWCIDCRAKKKIQKQTKASNWVEYGWYGLVLSEFLTRYVRTIFLFAFRATPTTNEPNCFKFWHFVTIYGFGPFSINRMYIVCFGRVQFERMPKLSGINNSNHISLIKCIDEWWLIPIECRNIFFS